MNLGRLHRGTACWPITSRGWESGPAIIRIQMLQVVLGQLQITALEHGGQPTNVEIGGPLLQGHSSTGPALPA